jgi:hypothetical protein
LERASHDEAFERIGQKFHEPYVALRQVVAAMELVLFLERMSLAFHQSSFPSMVALNLLFGTSVLARSMRRLREQR